jgi:hypothetical protein
MNPHLVLAAFVSSVLGILVSPTVGARSTQDESSAPASATTQAPPEAAELSEPAPAVPPRPRMGLVVPLTPPRQPASKTGVKSDAKSGATAGAKSGVYQDAKHHADVASRYQNTRGTIKSKHYYMDVWGVDRLRASYTSSGNLIKFSYRVIQPKLAKTLGEHQNAPELIGIRSNAVLHIPTMEKVGQLRQMSAAEANKDYWMVFSNKGNLVKPGDEVSVIIGRFRADGLIVE